MARKRVKKTEQQEDIFAALERHGTHNFQEPAPQISRQAAPAADAAALQEQITRLQSELDQTQRRAMMAPQAPVVVHQQEQRMRASDVKLDLSGLPDPTLDAASYNAALQQRINAVIMAQTQGVRDDLNSRANAEQEESQARERLWNGFVKTYPDWAEHEKLVDMVAGDVAAREAAKGVDTKRYILGDPTLFYKDVATELQARYGRLVEDDGENEAEVEGHPNEEEPAEGRTVGIMGGLESGGKPTAGRATQEGDMMKDLQAIQMKTGFF